MIHTSHDLSSDTRSGMVELPNRHLAATFDLYSQVKQAHWNVKGRAALSAVVEGITTLVASTRAAITQASEAGDEGTADLFTGFSRELDKQLRFVESHIQGD